MSVLYPCDLVGSLIKIRRPGMLLVNDDFGKQIFDSGGLNMYIMLEVRCLLEASSDNLVYVELLLCSEIYNWRGVRPFSVSMLEFLNSRFKKI